MKIIIKLFFITFALIGLYTILFDLSLSTNPINYFSKFTILSNCLTVGIFFYCGFRKEEKSFRIDSLRGAILLYMLITGIVYAVLLEAKQTDLSYPWISIMLHRVMPLAVIISWLVYPPSFILRFKDTLYWIIFPVIFVLYTLIRGYFVHWYPYDFLDPNLKGYLGVFAYFIAIALFGQLLSFAIIFVGNKFRLKSLQRFLPFGIMPINESNH
jgi:hypothetical protein